MLRMQPFELLFPTSLDAAIAHLNDYGTDGKLCAGGTDLVPNIKHGLHTPRAVVHLSRVAKLRDIKETTDVLKIGALTTLDALSRNQIVLKHFPALAYAAESVAGPQLRRMGTIGGNICLDTRCLYYNQTAFWREALGYCLKKDGTVCHVTGTGKRCVAAASNDVATMLLALNARVGIRGLDGERLLSLDEFYHADGTHNNLLAPSDILTHVEIPKESMNSKQGFSKLRMRQSIDFPMVSIGLSMSLNDGRIENSRVVANALAAKPRLLQTDWLNGKLFCDETRDELATWAQARCTPLTNICGDPAWRKSMVGVYIKRAWHNMNRDST